MNKGDGKIRKRVLKGGVNAIKWERRKTNVRNTKTDGENIESVYIIHKMLVDGTLWCELK